MGLREHETVRLASKECSSSLNHLFRYFRKAEKYTPHSGYPNINPELHGTDGPATTSHGTLAVGTPLSYA
jgi:hypothetical protein